MTTFTYNNATYTANDTFSTCFMTVGDTKTRIKKAEFQAAQAEYELDQAMKNPTPDTPEQDAPAETPAAEKAETPKERKHPTADKFKATIPEGYRFEVNNKGHIRIFKDDAAKTAYAKLVAKKDGVNICASKELRDTRSDLEWTYHEGWASKYVLKVADWDAVQKVLFPEPEEA